MKEWLKSIGDTARSLIHWMPATSDQNNQAIQPGQLVSAQHQPRTSTVPPSDQHQLGIQGQSHPQNLPDRRPTTSHDVQQSKQKTKTQNKKRQNLPKNSSEAPSQQPSENLRASNSENFPSGLKNIVVSPYTTAPIPVPNDDRTNSQKSCRQSASSSVDSTASITTPVQKLFLNQSPSVSPQPYLLHDYSGHPSNRISQSYSAHNDTSCPKY